MNLKISESVYRRFQDNREIAVSNRIVMWVKNFFIAKLQLTIMKAKAR